ncbi:hypothetical protein [Okeania sp. SIO1I7]|uniref:hypothetical protein n=1 Tax=Okeania sp. SIO1I7 TaxID=2607772 RepID=UPI0013F7DBD5|nr:hypothetical protein [Okeania sp. SIO1I7]NET24848.1 hypothetical protein [Okeania sp. SIO1I7]
MTLHYSVIQFCIVISFPVASVLYSAKVRKKQEGRGKKEEAERLNIKSGSMGTI